NREIIPSSKPQPIDPAFWPEKIPGKSHCSKCSLCETSYVTHVRDACAFLGDGMKRNIDGLEGFVHGRVQNLEDLAWGDSDANAAKEARFSVMHHLMMLARGRHIFDAQWTGCVTGIAVSMLEAGMVDAVVCISCKVDGDAKWSEPEPILARSVTEVMRGRGVKSALAPSLNILDELRDSPDIKKLLFCGDGCAVQAFRAIQHELLVDEVYVLGTNCADNSPTPEDAREFLRLSVPEITGSMNVLEYEFMQDFRVHVKYDNGSGSQSPSYERKPYFSLQFATHVSALSSGRLELGPEATGKGTHENFALATVSSYNILQQMVGSKIKTQGLPRFLGELMATIMTNVGPKGVSFARYSVDYHSLRNYLHCLDFWVSASYATTWKQKRHSES
ncbi:LOW QUALITY PROTEIN: hypothetical protein ACHAXA_007577, partial [Cyclostephanos tholiformis]